MRALLNFLLNFSPVVAALGLAVLAVVFLRSRSPRHIALAVALVLAGATPMVPEALLFFREALQPAPSISFRPVKVLTANLWTRNFHFVKFLALVSDENPDIIVVQEANGPWSFVLRGFYPKYKFVSGCDAPSQCNVAILSSLQAAPHSSRWTSTIASVELILPDQSGGGRLSVVGVHASRDIPTQPDQDIAAIVKLASQHRDRLILAGDFNSTPWSGHLKPLDNLQHIRRRTIGMATWPTPSRRFTPLKISSPLALFPIDYVYASDDFSTISVVRPADINSDHYPILATLSLNGENGDKR